MAHHVWLAHMSLEFTVDVRANNDFADRHEDFKDLRCMSFTAKGDREILVAGVQDQMFKVDVEKGTITETVGSTCEPWRANADWICP